MAKTKEKELPELEGFVSKVPPNDQRKVLKRPETIQQAMARGKKSKVVSKDWTFGKVLAEVQGVEYEPLIGYTCELCNTVNYVDAIQHIPTLRVCDDCKGKMKAKLSA